MAGAGSDPWGPEDSLPHTPGPQNPRPPVALCPEPQGVGHPSRAALSCDRWQDMFLVLSCDPQVCGHRPLQPDPTLPSPATPLSSPQRATS